MSRNYGFGEYKAISKASMNWPGIHRKISGGFIISTTKRGKVIPFPTDRLILHQEVLKIAGHVYRVRPGSWADRMWHLVSVPEE